MSKTRALNWLSIPEMILHSKRLCIGLLGIVSCLVLLLFVWVVGGNLVVSLQERNVDQAWEQLLKRFPRTETNNSALKLEELTAALGVEAFVSTSSSIPIRDLSVPAFTEQTPTFKDIQNDLNKYLTAQTKKFNDEIDIPPERLRHYLSSHEGELKAIYTHVLSSDLPTQEFDLSLLDPFTPLFSFLNSVNFQRILALDILEKTRQGQTQEALKPLEVSWKLNQALLKLPTLIAQLVHIISGDIQTLAIRKMQQVPSEWQEHIAHLIQYEQPQAFLSSLEQESFGLTRSLKNHSFSEIIALNQVAFRQLDAESPAIYNAFLWLGPLPDLLLTPHLRLVGIDHVKRVSRMVRELSKEDFCQLDPEAFVKKWKISDPWWSVDVTSPVMDAISELPDRSKTSWIATQNNPWHIEGERIFLRELAIVPVARLGWHQDAFILPKLNPILATIGGGSGSYFWIGTQTSPLLSPLLGAAPPSPSAHSLSYSWIGNWINQWRKVGRYALKMELTQKVLRVKELAAEQGRFPQQVPGLADSICRDAKWIYQVSTDGKTMSIAFDKREELDWLGDAGKSLIHHSQLK